MTITPHNPIESALTRENARLLNTIRVQAEAIELLRADSARLNWLLSEASDGNLAESEDLRVLIEQAWVLVTDCGDNYEQEDKIAAIDAAMKESK
jgi:hypothetical protein